MIRIHGLISFIVILILAMGLVFACGDDDDSGDDDDGGEGDDDDYTCEDICDGVVKCGIDCIPFDCIGYCETEMTVADLSCAGLSTCNQLEECLCDDDDSDDDTEDDDDGDDDDDDDDDDSSDCEWEEELTWFFDCAYIYDEEGNEMTLDEVIADCNECMGACAGGYMDADDCDSAIDCICANCDIEC